MSLLKQWRWLSLPIFGFAALVVFAGFMMDFDGGAQAKNQFSENHHSTLVSVQLRAPQGVPKHDDQPFTLIGKIRQDQDKVADVHYRWDLPPGAQIIKGDSENTIVGLGPGEAREIEITLKGFSAEDLQLVSLYGYIQQGETHQGRVASLTSRPQDSFEIAQRSPASTH